MKTIVPGLSVAAGMSLLLLAGCGKSSPPRPRPAHALPTPPCVSAAEPGKTGGRFVIAATGVPRTFNPLFTFDQASDAIVRMLFASLVRLDAVSQEPGPGLAESWTVAPDQKTWTLKLRKGLRWSDGEPLTAEDVVFTWNDVMYNPDLNKVTYDLFRINGVNFTVSELDETTVQVVTPEVFAPFLEFFGTVPVLPKHRLEPAVRQHRFPTVYGVDTIPDKLVGCGPYRLKDCQPGKFTLLERNSEYWVTDKQGKRLPYFDEVMFTVGGGPGTEMVLFLNGKNDVCETVRPDVYQQFKDAAASQKCQLVDMGIGVERDFLWFNQNTGTNLTGQPLVNPIRLKWFRNKKFRQAVSCAIDRERIVREVYGGRAEPARGFIGTENKKWYNPNTPRYDYDVARAEALLAEMGLDQRDKDGVRMDAASNVVEIIFSSNTGNPAREKTASLIQEDLRKVGIRLVNQPVDFKMLLQKVNATFDYECALMGLGGGAADPASQINVLRSSEELHQWFPFQRTPSTDWEARIDQLMEQQMRTLDQGARKKIFDEVQVIMAEEVPMIYLAAPVAAAAINPKVANLRPAVMVPYHLTWNIEELYFK
jgi:peptide/nickel transport system substrate-binding protein